jgi:transcriptional regulator with XRE-family HTH domain
MTLDKEPGAEDFGRRLKARRHELGLSRRDVVAASGLSYPYVSQLESGYRLPSHKSVAMLASALELEPSELSAALPYPDVSASPMSASARAEDPWRSNPSYRSASTPSRRKPSPRRVADEVAQLIATLPRDQRLDALSRAQRQVLDALVAEEVERSR